MKKNRNSIFRYCLHSFILLVIVLVGLLITRSFFTETLFGNEEYINKLEPYLQAVTPNSIYILVETTDKTPINAVYNLLRDSTGKSVKSNFHVETKTENKPTYVHRIKLDNLIANTEYQYFVFNDNDSSAKFSFHTSALPGQSFRFAVAGDMRSNPKIFTTVCNAIKKYSPKFSIYTGDVCYDSNYSSWKKEFLIPEHLKLAAEVPFFNAIGNHERWKQNTKAFQQAPKSASAHQAYYSFDYGDMHVLILSTEHNIGKKSKQWKFAKKDLESSKSKWKVVAFHIPAYCGGGHGENKRMKKMSKEIFEPNGVDFVFTGHSHFYQHNVVKGIHHLVLAGGGAPLYSPKKKKYTVKMKKTHHFAICDISPDKFKMTVYDLKGNIIDEIIKLHKE